LEVKEIGTRRKVKKGYPLNYSGIKVKALLGFHRNWPFFKVWNLREKVLDPLFLKREPRRGD